MENFYMERYNGYSVYFELYVRGRGTTTYSNFFHTILDAAIAISELWVDMKYRTSIKVGEFYAKAYKKDDIYIIRLKDRFKEYLLFALQNKEDEKRKMVHYK